MLTFPDNQIDNITITRNQRGDKIARIDASVTLNASKFSDYIYYNILLVQDRPSVLRQKSVSQLVEGDVIGEERFNLDETQQQEYQSTFRIPENPGTLTFVTYYSLDIQSISNEYNLGNYLNNINDNNVFELKFEQIYDNGKVNLTKTSYFDAQGEPYNGVVEVRDGVPYIEGTERVLETTTRRNTKINNLLVTVDATSADESQEQISEKRVNKVFKDVDLTIETPDSSEIEGINVGKYINDIVYNGRENVKAFLMLNVEDLQKNLSNYTDFVNVPDSEYDSTDFIIEFRRERVDVLEGYNKVQSKFEETKPWENFDLDFLGIYDEGRNETVEIEGLRSRKVDCFYEDKIKVYQFTDNLVFDKTYGSYRYRYDIIFHDKARDMLIDLYQEAIELQKDLKDYLESYNKKRNVIVARERQENTRFWHEYIESFVNIFDKFDFLKPLDQDFVEDLEWLLSPVNDYADESIEKITTVLKKISDFLDNRFAFVKSGGNLDLNDGGPNIELRYDSKNKYDVDEMFERLVSFYGTQDVDDGNVTDEDFGLNLDQLGKRFTITETESEKYNLSDDFLEQGQFNLMPKEIVNNGSTLLDNDDNQVDFNQQALNVSNQFFDINDFGNIGLNNFNIDSVQKTFVDNLNVQQVFEDFGIDTDSDEINEQCVGEATEEEKEVENEVYNTISQATTVASNESTPFNSNFFNLNSSDNYFSKLNLDLQNNIGNFTPNFVPLFSLNEEEKQEKQQNYLGSDLFIDKVINTDNLSINTSLTQLGFTFDFKYNQYGKVIVLTGFENANVNKPVWKERRELELEDFNNEELIGRTIQEQNVKFDGPLKRFNPVDEYYVYEPDESNFTQTETEDVETESSATPTPGSQGIDTESIETPEGAEDDNETSIGQGGQDLSFELPSTDNLVI